jgi:hypothetical protein
MLDWNSTDADPVLLAFLDLEGNQEAPLRSGSYSVSAATTCTSAKPFFR